MFWVTLELYSGKSDCEQVYDFSDGEFQRMRNQSDRPV